MYELRIEELETSIHGSVSLLQQSATTTKTTKTIQSVSMFKVDGTTPLGMLLNALKGGLKVFSQHQHLDIFDKLRFFLDCSLAIYIN